MSYNYDSTAGNLTITLNQTVDLTVSMNGGGTEIVFTLSTGTFIGANEIAPGDGTNEIIVDPSTVYNTLRIQSGSPTYINNITFVTVSIFVNEFLVTVYNASVNFTQTSVIFTNLLFDIQTDRNIDITDGSELQGQAGSFMFLHSNRQAIKNTGSFHGLQLRNNSKITVYGNSLDIRCFSGDSGNNYGIWLDGSDTSIISANANITMEGTSLSNGVNSMGVRISGGSQIITDSVNVTVTGQGSTIGTSTSNHGVSVDSGSRIECQGNLTVNGYRGGVGSASFSHGVNVDGINSVIKVGVFGTLNMSGAGAITQNGNGNFGINLSSSGIITTDGGNITVNGTGGGSSTSGSNYGIILSSGGNILSIADSILNVTGNGGNTGTGSSNYGIFINGASSFISTTNGDATITGTGGGSGSSGLNMGIHINAGVISSLGTGSIIVNGNGGSNVSGNDNLGIFLSGSTGLITSSNGNVTVNANGGGLTNTTSGLNIGIRLDTGATINAGGDGNVIVNTVGGNGNGNENYGLQLNTSTVLSAVSITSNNGNVTVTATGGGNGGSSNNNMGIRMFTPSTISAGGSGNVSITGTGGGATAGTTGSNNGVNLEGALTLITSSSLGNLIVNGYGGGHNLGSGLNRGVRLLSGATIRCIGVGTMNVTGVGGLAVSSATSSNNTGIAVFSSSFITSSSSGISTITGTGGGDGASNAGVVVTGAGTISTTGTGNMTLTGNGSTIAVGTSTNNSNFNYGIIVSGASSNISTTSSGNLTLNGNAGGSGIYTNSNYGIGIIFDGNISSTSSGVLTITCNGSSVSEGNFNHGMYIDGSNSKISTVTGDINIISNAGGTGPLSRENMGVQIFNNGSILSTGLGIINVYGKGGGGSDSTVNFNHGILIKGSLSKISSTSNNIILEGIGGGTGNSRSNIGISITSGGSVTTTGSFNITLECAGGLGSGFVNTGLYLEDADSKITSQGGDINIISVGGPNSLASNGLFLSEHVLIETNGNGEININSESNSYDAISISTKLNHVVTDPPKTKIKTVDGNITLTGVIKLNGNGYGVNVYWDSVITTETGIITINGTGGEAVAGFNNGIVISDSLIECTTSGNIILKGDNRINSGANSSGVKIENLSIINTLSGNITIEGTTNAVGIESHGISIESSNINSTVGDVSIIGRGSINNTADNCHGLQVKFSEISGDGLFTMQGYGGGSGENNYGVYLANNTIVQSNGSNLLSEISGEASEDGGLGSVGVYLSDTEVYFSGTVDGGGGGNVIAPLQGFGGFPENNHGVVLTGQSSIIASGSDNIVINGSSNNLISNGIRLEGESFVQTNTGDILLSGGGANGGAGLVTIGDTLVQSTSGDINIIGGYTPFGNSIPTLVTTGDININGAVNIFIDSNGNNKVSAGTGQINIINGVLNIDMDSALDPASGTIFIIIQNTGTNSIQGTFAGYANASNIQINSKSFEVSYLPNGNMTLLRLEEEIEQDMIIPFSSGVISPILSLNLFVRTKSNNLLTIDRQYSVTTFNAIQDLILNSLASIISNRLEINYNVPNTTSNNYEYYFYHPVNGLVTDSTLLANRLKSGVTDNKTISFIQFVVDNSFDQIQIFFKAMISKTSTDYNSISTNNSVFRINIKI